MAIGSKFNRTQEKDWDKNIIRTDYREFVNMLENKEQDIKKLRNIIN